MNVDTKRRNRKRRRGREPSAQTERSRAPYWTSAILLIVVLFFAAVRFHWRSLPLERDEGEYAYCGQLMLQRIPPYQLAYNMKLPGTYAAYALLMSIFGETSGGIHVGFLLVNVATTLLIFLVGRKLFGNPVGAISGAAYAVLSASTAVLGLAAHATHFVVLGALAGILLLLYALESDRALLFFLSGTCLGFAFLMKQPGIVFPLFAFAYWAYRKWDRRGEWRYVISRGGAFVTGTIWPFVVTCILLYWAGDFHNFWFWTFTYARAYGSYVPISAGLRNFKTAVKGLLHFDGGIWLMAGLGFVVLFLNRRPRTHIGFMVGLLVFSFLGVSAGLYFREHYFVLLLPAAALLCGIALVDSTDALRERRSAAALVAIPALIFALSILLSVLRERDIFFAANRNVACRRLYPNDPFLEAEALAEYLRTNTSPSVRLAIFGSEPEIYFSSQRHSATGYVYTYALMEQQKYAIQMREEMLREVAEARPEYVLLVDDQRSWLWFSPTWQEDFFLRILSYISDNYEKTAMVRIAGNAGHGMGDAAAIYLFHLKAQ